MEGMVDIEEKYLRAIVGKLIQDKPYFYARIVGESMLPTVKKDSTVMIKTGLHDISIGDIIAFINQNHITLHRVIDIPSPQEYVTKGDNSPEQERVSDINVIGKVIRINCDNKEDLRYQ